MRDVYKMKLTGDHTLDDEPITRAEILRHLEPIFYLIDIGDLTQAIIDHDDDSPDEFELNPVTYSEHFPLDHFDVFATEHETFYLVEKM